MRFLSLCSGIEAASVAWGPLGWEAVAFAEVAAFPSAVLAHRYPHVPNHGDMTRFREWPDHAVDLVCGGTPCQAFSVAGLRQGLADPRGNLALTFLGIVDRYQPQWVVWENVFGVLSSNGGRDFAAFLGGLGHLGYGWCYRVLDAQYVRVDGFPRAVPQRRRRVFVVGCLGDWARAAAVLSEPESVLGDTPPRREAWAGVAAGTLGGVGPGGGWRFGADEAAAGHLIPFDPTQITHPANRSNPKPGDPAPSLAKDAHPPAIAGQLIAFDGQNLGCNSDVSAALDTGGAHANRGMHVAMPMAFDWYASQSQSMPVGEISPPLKTTMQPAVAQPPSVRRLTPTECERLMGFPDGYTAVPFRGRPAADGPRYAALGNSWAVNVARWIGRRIEIVEEVAAEIAAGREAAE